MDSSSISLQKRPQRSQRLDYRLLNDGSDEEAAEEDRIDKKRRLRRTDHSDSITPNESASRCRSASPVGESHIQEESNNDDNPPSDTASAIHEAATSRARPLNHSLWAEFLVSPLPGKLWWPKRGKGPVEDREIRCVRCSWKTTDSARATSTSNMKLHLSKHGIFQSSSEDSREDNSSVRQQSIASFFQKKAEMETKKTLGEDLLRWTVIDEMAFSSIESPAFRRIFDNMGIPIPFNCRRTMVRRIEEEFDQRRTQLIDELARTCQTVALSLDVWTSKNSKAILAVIGHWLKDDFEDQERVFEFVEISGVHSGENMAELLQNTLEELQIEQKLLTITADNAANNESLVSELFFNITDKFSGSISLDGARSLRFQGEDSYIRCMAHVLNLIVSDILSALKAGDHGTAVAACDLMQKNREIGPHSALARLRIMALWIARTPQRKQQWKLICQTNRLKDKFIEYDVDTRWNSTYRMLKDALGAKPQIRKWIEHQTYLPPFTAEDWDHLEQIENLLAKFDEFTLVVSKRQPQISLAIPIYYELHDVLNNAASREEEFSDLHPDISAAASAGLKKFQKYYDLMDSQDAYYVALMLDPRFKALLLEKELGSEASKIINHIKELLHEQYPSAREQSPAINEDRALHSHSIEARVLQRLQPQKQRLSDIERYFEDGVVSIDESVTKEKNWLLSWWRSHGDEYPRMAVAARDYLAIPASEVSVERLFNNGGDLVGLRRHSLGAETMRRLMLLRDMYLAEM